MLYFHYLKNYTKYTANHSLKIQVITNIKNWPLYKDQAEMFVSSLSNLDCLIPLPTYMLDMLDAMFGTEKLWQCRSTIRK